jgi:signal transduction histidine kinase
MLTQLSTIRSLLAALVLGVAVPVMGLSIAVALVTAARHRSDITDTLIGTARLVGATVDGQLVAAMRELAVLAASRALADRDLRGFHEQARTLLAIDTTLSAVVLVEPDGRQLVNTARPFGAALPSSAGRTVIDHVVRERRPAVSDLLVGRVSGDPVVVVAVPVPRGSDLPFVLLGVYTADTWHAILTAEANRSGMVLAVVDRENVFIARSGSAVAGRRRLDAEFSDRSRRQREGLFRTRSLEGVPIYRAFHRSELAGWTISVSVPTEVLDAPWWRSFIWLVVGGLAVVAGSVGFAAVVARRLTQPLRALERYAASIRIDHGLPAPTTFAVKEVRDVASVLATTAARLRTLHELDVAILAARSPADIAADALRRLRMAVSVPRASLTLIDEAAQRMSWVAVDTDTSTSLGAGRSAPVEIVGDLDALRAGQVQRICVDSLPTEPEREALLAEGVHHYVVIPLVTEGRLIGSLNFGSTHLDALDDAAVAVGSEIADHLAIALEQARLRAALTERAEMLERRVAERTRRLGEINQELEAFAYSVSHDLRAPLRAMDGFARALLRLYGDVLDATGKDYAERIVAAAGRMDRLVRELLAYSRITRAQFALRSVELTTVVADAMRELTTDVPQADVTIASPLPAVLADRATLVQVVTNVLSNAAKFVRPGVRPSIAIHAEREARRVRLWIEDNGIGVAPEHRERIFGVFERLHGAEEYPGTGIGLAIVSKGVQRMNGSAGVESRANGSAFWIELDAANGDAGGDSR